MLALTFTLGGQTYFFEQYNAYLNIDVSVFATDLADSVVNQLWADIRNYSLSLVAPLVFATLVAWCSARYISAQPRLVRWATWVSPLLLTASFFVPTQHRHVQASTPDILYLNAIGGVLQTQLGLTEQSDQIRPKLRHSLRVPALTPHPSRPRNIVFFILESVRADAACSVPGPDCQSTPYSSQLVPDRIGLEQLRSVDSCTAISLAVLWTGVAPTESREILHTWPLIFDYARSAGYDTAFWTSQNMMFGNARLWVQNLGVNQFCSATDLDPTSDLDMGAPEGLLAQRVRRDLSKLKEPYLAVIQLSNVHYPYLVDPDAPQPFQPSKPSKAGSDSGWFFNHYKNAVHQQDRHVAAMISAVKSDARAERTVILYTSDHGEGFREHGVTGHTFSVFDEEIKVPGWIDAPEGTLSPEEVTNLRQNAKDFSFHTDITPTVLSLLGIWGDKRIEEFRSKMIGISWLEPPAARKPQPLTNCAGVWSCAFENWGYMVGSLKFHARSWDEGYQCYDILDDPGEFFNLGDSQCQLLRDLAHGTFERAPGH